MHDAYGAAALRLCSPVVSLRRSSGTITGGAIPPSPLRPGLLSWECVAHCTWANVSVMYNRKGGQRITTRPRDLSLMLWNAEPYRPRIKNYLPGLAAAVVLQLMKIFIFILMRFCGCLWICLFWCSGVVREVSDLSRGARYFLMLLKSRFCFMCAKPLAFWCQIRTLFLFMFSSAENEGSFSSNRFQKSYH